MPTEEEMLELMKNASKKATSESVPNHTVVSKMISNEIPVNSGSMEPAEPETVTIPVPRRNLPNPFAVGVENQIFADILKELRRTNALLTQLRNIQLSIPISSEELDNGK